MIDIEEIEEMESIQAAAKLIQFNNSPDAYFVIDTDTSFNYKIKYFFRKNFSYLYYKWYTLKHKLLCYKVMKLIRYGLIKTKPQPTTYEHGTQAWLDNLTNQPWANDRHRSANERIIANCKESTKDFKLINGVWVKP